MESSRRGSFSSSWSTTVTYNFPNRHLTPTSQPNSTQVPVESLSNTPISVTINPPQRLQFTAATKIQSAYRAHLIRSLYRTIATANYEAERLENLIQRQETVDAIVSNDREKLRMNESLMALLLKLDSVPGIDPTVREARRKVSRRIVGLQEIVDAISGAKVGVEEWCYDGFTRWDEVMAEMEEEVCMERGGDEMERFCAQYLGFRCLQRFLRET